jgi:hypothetical protein
MAVSARQTAHSQFRKNNNSLKQTRNLLQAELFGATAGATKVTGMLSNSLPVRGVRTLCRKREANRYNDQLINWQSIEGES